MADKNCVYMMTADYYSDYCVTPRAYVCECDEYPPR